MGPFLRAFAIGMLIAPAYVPPAIAAAPDAIVKATVDDVVGAIRKTKDKRALHELAEQKVLPHFDFTRMTQLAAGSAWRTATPAQQQALENGFRSLLVNTYVNALTLTASAGQSIDVKPTPLQPQQSEATVRTVMKESGKQPVAIDYRMAYTPAGWKVYDVSVENLSLVTNYRGTFAGEISRSGIDGLIKVLEDKNRSLAQS
jgi:phospholipid transport system substrate-binding protein